MISGYVFDSFDLLEEEHYKDGHDMGMEVSMIILDH